MAELNGEAPLEGGFTDHFKNKLNESDSDDDGESISNAYESVSDIAYFPIVVPANGIISLHIVMTRVTTPAFHSPPRLVMILTRRTSNPSIYPMTIAVQSLRPVRPPQAHLSQRPNQPMLL